MAHLGTLQLLVFTALVGGGIGTVAATLWWLVGREGLRRMRPAPRLRRLLGMAALPILGVGLLTGAALLPSLLDALGLVADHCSAHPDHHLHLCLVHGGHVHASSLGWALVGLVSLGGGIRAARVVWRWARATGRLRRLRKAAVFDEQHGVWRISSELPFAVTVGLLSPRVLVSDALADSLSEDELQVVRSHEEVHARRRHALWQVLVELAGSLHLPAVRGFLAEEVDLACEQIADREAVGEAAGPVGVADTILAVERLLEQTDRHRRLRPVFDGSDVERRVVGLLDRPWTGPSSGAAAAVLTTVVSTLLFSYASIHHGLETLFSLLL